MNTKLQRPPGGHQTGGNSQSQTQYTSQPPQDQQPRSGRSYSGRAPRRPDPSAEDVARELGGVRSGDGWSCHCPAHDDKHRSLSLHNDRTTGRLIWYCHAGCSQGAVKAALETRSLYPGAPVSPATAARIPVSGKPRDDADSLVSPVPDDAPPLPVEFHRLGAPSKIWAYRDKDGSVLCYELRFDRPGGKEIRPLTLWRKEDGYEWRMRAYPAPTPLYGLEELARCTDDPVLIVEGPKTADAARMLFPDLCVVAWMRGAKAVDRADLRPLAGKQLHIWPDNDDPGKAATSTLAGLAMAAGVASVATVNVPADFPEKWDLADPLPEGCVPEELRGLLDAATPWQVPETPETSEEWPDPKPITAELLPVPAFDPDVLLSEPLRAWVMDEADRMPCPPDYVAAAAIVALGSVIGARCGVKPKRKDDWLVIPNIWGGIVGEPAAKKSPASSAAFAHLDRLAAKARDAYQTAHSVHETERLVFDARKEAISARIKEAARKPDKGNPESIAQEMQVHLDGAPEVPAIRRYKTNDCTVEKLGELLRDNPTGLLVLRDELVGLLAGWEREGREGERAFFLEAWNGNQGFDTDRIGRGTISISNLCVSIFGGIQPDKLTGYMEQSEHALSNDGMLQRFQVLVFPDIRRWEWRDRAPLRDAYLAARAVFETVADFDPVHWGAEPADEMSKFSSFHFDDDAQQVLIEWTRKLHEERIPSCESSILKQHLAKYDKLFPALALIHHLVECAAGRVSGPIQKESALRARAWCDYLEAHARRCYGLLMDDGLRAAKALAARIEDGKLDDGFTVRDIRRHQWRHLTEDKAIVAALEWLEGEDWLRPQHTAEIGSGGGRPTTRYRINPKVKRKVDKKSA